ncbi:hypothetical protein LIER_05977 [Lithospermum erythrorhizon]|uniref:Uncharacterized protein n=1 Tax=Lithospermum erythrorhizon TaxID=34254 RepID=A0AAV3P2U6_LITER
MGGGGVMRAVAKVGIRAANCGFRSEHPVTKAATANPTSSSSKTEAKLYVSSSENDITPARVLSEFEEWEFAEEEEYVAPRLVFGEAPSFVEAKEATSQLKDALQRTYLSSPSSTGSRDSYKSGHVYAYSDVSQTKPCVTSEKILAPAPSKHAMQAFRFLSETPAAQNVVASIASDPNVWNAVLQNPDLQEFLSSQKSSKKILFPHSFSGHSCFHIYKKLIKLLLPNSSFFGEGATSKGSVTDDFFFQTSPKASDGDSDDGESGGLADFLNNIKVTVVDIWSSLSDYFQSLFSGPAGVNPNADGTARIGFTDKALNGSFIGLAVMAILVVVLKRN